jgi:hypothetical protein
MGGAPENNTKEPTISVTEPQPNIAPNVHPSGEVKKEMASPTASLSTMSPPAVEQQKILSHIGNLSEPEKTAFVTAAAQQLPDQAKRAVAGSLQPSAPAADLIWKVIVFAFAISFGVSILGLIGVVLLSIFYSVEQANVQVLLTIVTTVGGILAGFISGRASTSANY